MSKAQNLFQIEIQKPTIFVDDFTKIMMDFNPGDGCVIDFSKIQQFDPPKERFKILLQQMIAKSGSLILLGPECCEEIANGILDEKFHFILKSFSAGFETSTEKSWKELIKSISQEFFENYFSSTQDLADEKVECYAAASILIRDGSKEYQFGLIMGQQCLNNAIAKVLLLGDTSDFGDCKELVAEVLNMVCSHIRSRLKQRKMDIKMEVPRVTELQVVFPPTDADHWILQNLENKMGFYLKEVNDVSA